MRGRRAIDRSVMACHKLLAMTNARLDLTFRQLEVLMAVVRHGSFGAAADELGISQVSVSKHIAGLERATGITVFERQQGRAAKLTVGGLEVTHFAEMVLAGYDKLRQQKLGETEPRRGQVLIAASEATIDLSFMPRLASFCAAHPGIEVRFVPVPSSLSSLAKLDGLKVDLAYLALSETPEYVSGNCLGRLECSLYAQTKLANAIQLGKRPVPVIWPPDGGPVSRVMAEALVSANLAPYEAVQHLQRLSSGLDLARHGLGVSCLPRSQAQEFVAAGELEDLGGSFSIYSYVIPIIEPLTPQAAEAQKFFSLRLSEDTIPQPMR